MQRSTKHTTHLEKQKLKNHIVIPRGSTALRHKLLESKVLSFQRHTGVPRPLICGIRTGTVGKGRLAAQDAGCTHAPHTGESARGTLWPALCWVPFPPSDGPRGSREGRAVGQSAASGNSVNLWLLNVLPFPSATLG